MVGGPVNEERLAADLAQLHWAEVTTIVAISAVVAYQVQLGRMGSEAPDIAPGRDLRFA